MTELTLFASTFILVFALGLQSLNVNNGHYILAALTSFVIGSGQMILYKLAPHAGWTEIAAYLIGGPFGIVSAMLAHPYLARLMKREPKPKKEYKGHIPPRPIPVPKLTPLPPATSLNEEIPHIPQPQPGRSNSSARWPFVTDSDVTD